MRSAATVDEDAKSEEDFFGDDQAVLRQLSDSTNRKDDNDDVLNNYDDDDHTATMTEFLAHHKLSHIEQSLRQNAIDMHRLARISKDDLTLMASIFRMDESSKTRLINACRELRVLQTRLKDSNTVMLRSSSAPKERDETKQEESEMIQPAISRIDADVEEKAQERKQDEEEEELPQPADDTFGFARMSTEENLIAAFGKEKAMEILDARERIQKEEELSKNFDPAFPREEHVIVVDDVVDDGDTVPMREEMNLRTLQSLAIIAQAMQMADRSRMMAQRQQQAMMGNPLMGNPLLGNPTAGQYAAPQMTPQMAAAERLQRQLMWMKAIGAQRRIVDAKDLPSRTLSAEIAYRYRRSGIVCKVCTAGYETGDVVSTMPGCGCQYHKTCIDAWLSENDHCPIDDEPIFASYPF